MKYNSLHFGVVAFIFGIGLADIFREYWVLNAVFILLAFLLWKKISVAQAILYSFLFFLGSLRLFFALPEDKGIFYSLAKEEQKISVVGIIDSLPEQSPEKISFFLQSQAWQKIPKKDEEFSEWKKISERVFVSIYGIHSFKYGMKISLQGEIKVPQSSPNFSYARFLEREGVYAYFSSARASIVDSNPENSLSMHLWQKVFALREIFETKVREKLPSPESEYALGIILGAEKGIPQDIIDDFNDTGLRHLLALSGFNITILLLFVFWCFSFLPIKFRIVLALVVIAFFVGLTGASSSVVRAALMGGIGMIILHSGRDLDTLALIGITLFCLLLWNPFLLVADPGLQLSILAVLGLYWYVPKVEKIIVLPEKFPLQLKQALWATLAAQIFTLPVMIFYFQQFSFVSPLANMVVAPLTTLSMLFSTLVVVPYIGIIFIPLAYIFLHFALTFAHLLASIPMAVVSFPQIPVWVVILSYIPLVWFVVRTKK